MNNNNNNPLINVLKEKHNKKIRLVLKNGFSYITSDLKIIDENSVIFHDKFNNEMIICVSEIVQVMEVNF